MQKIKLNEISNRWKAVYLVTLTLALISLIKGIKKEYPIYTDFLYNTPSISSLEKKVGTNVCFELMPKNEAEERARIFGKTYNHIKEHWDNLEKQMGFVDHIVLKKNGTRDSMSRYKGDIYLSYYGGSRIIHELAHKWHEKLSDKKRFDREWKDISRSFYVRDYKNATDEQLNNNGSTSKYSIKNLLEDVAETTTLVYKLNDPDIHVKKFLNKNSPEANDYVNGFSYRPTKESLNKVIKKVTLLRRYDFFSQREYDNAISELEGFQLN